VTERNRVSGGRLLAVRRWSRRTLARLGVVQRLVLLVVLPLTAVAALTLPLIVSRTADASAAGSVARTAAVDRAAGRLLQQLQRERLLSVVYLATPDIDPLPLLNQAQNVGDQIRDVRTVGDNQMRQALARMQDLLTTVRTRVLTRTVTGAVAHTVFSQAASLVLAALPAQSVGASASVRAVRSLDELIRANEEAARVGAALVVAASEPAAGRVLLADAATAQRVHSDQFLALARAEHRQLLAAAEASQAAQRVAELSGQLPDVATSPEVSGQVASAVEAYTTLRRLVGDRIARDIASNATAAAGRARSLAIGVGLLAVLLVIVVSALTGAGARSIAVPLRRLSEAARAVSEATGQELRRVGDTESEAQVPTTLRAVAVSGPSDVADLAAAFNTVQEYAVALLDRQVLTRRNISAMFATVARRTGNLADRQLNLIDTLERHQQDAALLDHLYRLDHVATRLRRSAAALLVISGDTDRIPGPPMRLADIVRAAAAEIEQYTRVRLTEAVDVAAVPRLVPDLILMVAELLDNAVSFSPPSDPVTVSVTATGDGCQITIVDTGIGMSDEQLAAENARLVARERLDIAPTQVLGLFVVGRLARRANLRVVLDHTRPNGLTVHLGVPSHLLTTPVPGAVRPVLEAGPRPAARPPDGPPSVSAAAAAAAAAIQAAIGAQPFPWFGRQPAAEPDRAAAPVARSDGDGESRSGLLRRTPGAHLPEGGPADEADTQPRTDRDPLLDQDTLTAFNTGFARGIAAVPNLIRRRPGARLDRSLREEVPVGAANEQTVPIGPIERDPDAEQRSVERFLNGFAQGVADTRAPRAPERAQPAPRAPERAQPAPRAPERAQPAPRAPERAQPAQPASRAPAPAHLATLPTDPISDDEHDELERA
jgi:signal transduction histidine kinase